MQRSGKRMCGEWGEISVCLLFFFLITSLHKYVRYQLSMVQQQYKYI